MPLRHPNLLEGSISKAMSKARSFGVRNSLIPLLVKWNGGISTERKLDGGGPQGATFGIWEYLAHSNSSADCVDLNYPFIMLEVS